LILAPAERIPFVPRRFSNRIDQSPLAVSSSGGIVIGLGYAHDLRSTEQLVEVLRSGKLAGELFVGLLLTGRRRATALKHLDDASAEIAATSDVCRRRSGRRHR
jgi:hypothetical protein